jgi:hypothetical protein
MMGPEEKAAAAAVSGSVAEGSIEGAPLEENLSGIPAHFHAIAREFGRAKFEQVYTMGVAQHAMNILANGVGRNMELFNAVLMAVEMLNKISLLHIQARGWEAAELAKVDAEIRRSMDSRIIVPRSGVRGLDS